VLKNKAKGKNYLLDERLLIMGFAIFLPMEASALMIFLILEDLLLLLAVRELFMDREDLLLLEALGEDLEADLLLDLDDADLLLDDDLLATLLFMRFTKIKFLLPVRATGLGVKVP